ncbi:MAG: hypothetical protein M0D57_14385 [Sphingobacteriales bacterium JAD_PAG50586_3]|nr:MAG: hypothetical protein M0D57_14385 [Sphingobacteriales bacterium JAD_PAG50586_3]
MEDVQLLILESKINDLAYNEDYSEAINMLSQMLNKYPNSYRTYLIGAKIFAAIEKWEKCLEFSLKASELEKNNGDIWNHLGTAYCFLGKYVEGINAFKNGLELKHEATENNVRYWVGKLKAEGLI